jgi:hypothetical protein
VNYGISSDECRQQLPDDHGHQLAAHEVPVFEQGTKRWILFPAKPVISANGLVTRDDRGHAKYTPVLQILDGGIRREFSAAVIDALIAYAPNAFTTK